VGDATWREVVGVPDDGGGSFCVDCFLERANRAGVYVHPAGLDMIPFQPGMVEGD